MAAPGPIGLIPEWRRLRRGLGGHQDRGAEGQERVGRRLKHPRGLCADRLRFAHRQLPPGRLGHPGRRC